MNDYYNKKINVVFICLCSIMFVIFLILTITKKIWIVVGIIDMFLMISIIIMHIINIIQKVQEEKYMKKLHEKRSDE